MGGIIDSACMGKVLEGMGSFHVEKFREGELLERSSVLNNLTDIGYRGHDEVRTSLPQASHPFLHLKVLSCEMDLA